MQLVFTPIHQTGNTVIKPQAPRPHPIFRRYIRNKHKYCIMSVQNISQHFRLTCRLKGPFEADFQWFNLYLFLLSCLMPLFQWRRSSNSANYRHKLSSRGAWVVHTPPHRTITDESIQQINSHHCLPTIPDAPNLLTISLGEEHRQNIYVVVNTATKG